MAITSQIGIIDSTTAEGLTAGALAMWQAAIAGAERAGLARVVMTAGAGGGHASHGHGTEIDLVGYNADGSRWTPAQRVMVAAGAATAGANRFGFYSGGRGGNSLHIGLGYNGAPRNAAWGPGGQTSGVSVNAFHGPEREFVMALRGGTMASYLPTVGAGTPTGRPVDVRLKDADDFKADVSSDEAKAADIAANRRSMLDSVAPAVHRVIERGGLLRVGIDGDAVRQLQAFLNRAGMRDGEGRELDEDGIFGPLTKQALEAYQEAHEGLVVDGILGPETFRRMAGDITGADAGAVVVAPPVYTPSPPMQQAAAAAAAGLGRRSQGDAVRELQEWLRFHGFTPWDLSTLEVDGDFGPLTEQALAAAQRAAGLPETGRFDEAAAAAFQALDQHELNVTLPDVNATAALDEAIPPVAARPFPDRDYDEVYDQPTVVTDAQAAQYAEERGMVTEAAPPATTATPAAPEPRVPPGWRPRSPGTIGAPDGDPDYAAIYSSPGLTDAQRAQYAEERRPAPAAPPPAAPMVRSVPVQRGQVPLVWAIPVAAAPVGPLASPYPVRLTVQPTPLPRTPPAVSPQLAANVAYENALAQQRATEPQRRAEQDARMRARDAATTAEANRAGADEEAANATYSPVAASMTPAAPAAPTGAPRPVATTVVEPDAYQEILIGEGWMPARRDDFNRDYDTLPGVVNPPGRVMAPEGGTSYRPPTAVETSTLAPFDPPFTTGRLNPNLNSVGPGALPAPTFATMTREQLMGVNPATLTREQWTDYDAALQRQLDALRSAGPDWLRDKLRRNGAPAEKVARASAGEMIAMTAQVDNRMVPAGLATAPPKPPKNNALDKTKLLVRPAQIPAAGALA